MSNLPNYTTYYYLKNNKNKNNNNNKLKISKLIQKTLFFSIRIPILGYIVYDFSSNIYNNGHDLTPIIILTPLYILGVFWSFKMCIK